MNPDNNPARHASHPNWCAVSRKDREVVDRSRGYHPTQRPGPKLRRGFTVVELIIIVGIVGILAGLLLPGIAKATGSAKRVQCLSNERQLMLTWNLYAGDNIDAAVANGHGVPAGPESRRLSETLAQKFWVAGDNHFYYPAFTNSAMLTDPEDSLFARYLPAPGIYKCPEDKGCLTTASGETVPHVRSYALNAYLGWATDPGELTPGYKVVSKLPEIGPLSPAAVFVFQDVHPDNLCMPAFVVNMPGKPETDGFYHYPSGLHNRGGVISFADGHAQRHRWMDTRTLVPVTGKILGHWDPSPQNADLAWIRERTTVAVCSAL